MVAGGEAGSCEAPALLKHTDRYPDSYSETLGARNDRKNEVELILE